MQLIVNDNCRRVYEAFRKVDKATDKQIAELLGESSEHVVRPWIDSLLQQKLIDACEDYFDAKEFRVYRQCCVKRHLRNARNRLECYLDIYRQWRVCDKCSLAGERKSVVIGRGNLSATVMLIGSGPDAIDEKNGLPFSGKHSSLGIQLLKQHGFDESSCFFTNLVGCNYTVMVGTAEVTAPPEKEFLQACRPRVEQLLDLVYPRIVVLIGDVVADNFLYKAVNRFPITHRGVTIFSTRDFSCYDPLREDYAAQKQSGEVEWRMIKRAYEEALSSSVEPDITWKLPLVYTER